MAHMALSPSQGSLSVLLSQALVAFTIEMDNEAELRLPHTTGRLGAGRGDGSGGGDRGGRVETPWLTSFAMYANGLQYIEEKGTTVAELGERARTSRLLLGGLRRWRYLTVQAPAGQPLRTPPQPECVVRLTPAGRRACARGGRRPLACPLRRRCGRQHSPYAHRPVRSASLRHAGVPPQWCSQLRTGRPKGSRPVRQHGHEQQHEPRRRRPGGPVRAPLGRCSCPSRSTSKPRPGSRCRSGRTPCASCGPTGSKGPRRGGSRSRDLSRRRSRDRCACATSRA